ncbi:MAG: hypothetical protein ACRCS3_00835 [Paracoccaceae bacterium]
MTSVLALAAAIAMLLQVIEALVPATRKMLPLGGNGFVQTAGLMLGALAIWSLWDVLTGGTGSGPL